MSNQNASRRRPRRLNMTINPFADNTISFQSNSPTSSSDSEGDRPSPITSKIYLGSQFDAMNKETLKNYGIKKVLTIQLEDLPQKYKPKDQNCHKFIKMRDCASANIMEKFDEAIDFLKKCESSEGNTLVHCRMGISRSATICTAYLMKEKKLDFEEAFQRVREQRPQAGPNFGFLGQLKRFENRMSQAMVH